jgi:hypothetical protein
MTQLSSNVSYQSLNTKYKNKISLILILSF